MREPTCCSGRVGLAPPSSPQQGVLKPLKEVAVVLQSSRCKTRPPKSTAVLWQMFVVVVVVYTEVAKKLRAT